MSYGATASSLVCNTRPGSSVVEHFHGKEGVASSILARGPIILGRSVGLPSRRLDGCSWLGSSVG
jgi:hypothetical protein